MPSVWVFALLGISLARAQLINHREKDLVLVHTLFRHGDRTTEQFWIYPNDPYINETYFPYGVGQLTNEGKRREFTLGKVLRSRYNRFLGDLYTPDLLDAWSSDVTRTKMSLELVLAGLFPPNLLLRWNLFLDWQPIPYNYVPVAQDRLFLGGMTCPNFSKYYGAYLKTPEIQKKLQENQETIQYLSQYSGKNVTNFYDCLSIFDTLHTEEEWGFKLPEWTAKVYPEPLRKLAVEEFALRSGSLDLRKLGAGYFLQKLVQDTQAKINGTLVPQDRKLFVYSGHDLTVACILGALDIFKPDLIPFGADIMFEISKRKSQYGIEIYYLEDNLFKPTLMKLPECESFCPWEKFVAIVEKYFPSEDFCG